MDPDNKPSAKAADIRAQLRKLAGIEEKVAPKIINASDYGFVHHVFENKYYQNKGGVWGPTLIENVKLFLRRKFGIKEDDELDDAIIDIQLHSQVFAAMNVAGYKSGVYKDAKGDPYLVTQSHKLTEPVQGDWSLIKEMIESMWGPVQAPYVYAWLHWAYLSYEKRTLSPGQMLVMVGPKNCGKTLFQEKVISPLLGSTAAKCLAYLMDKTEFNPELISNCHWTLSDSISDLSYQQRKTLTERTKEVLVNSEQRLRGLYANPVTVSMCPRISASINWSNIDALPIFEEGMSDKMMLTKCEKSSKLPDEYLPRLEFEAELRKALPGFAYYLKHEFKVPDEIKESGNVRFLVNTYHHPDIVAQIVDVKRHVHLAEMLFKWQDRYEPLGTPLDMWSSLTKYDAESAKAVLALAPSAKTFGRIMTELCTATKKDYCCGVKVTKPPRGDNRQYCVEFDPTAAKPANFHASVAKVVMPKLKKR